MTEAKVMKGKDPECLLYDCPHKIELSKAQDEVSALQSKNQELNQRLESIENLINQGLTDFKGIISEIVKDKFKPEDIDKIIEKINITFDTKKITEIVNENLNLRKTINAKDMRIAELQNQIFITIQQKEALDITIKAREEKDLALIKEIRTMGERANEQIRELRINEDKINKQEQHLRMLKDFIIEAREDIENLKSMKQELEVDNKTLKKESYITRKLNLNPDYKPKEVKKVLNLCKSIKTAKNKSIFKFIRKNPDKQYFKLKTAYFTLTQAEKELCTEEYDEVAKMMGE